MESSTLSRTVMRRVRIIHAVRPLASGSALAAFLLLLAAWGIGREVWVAHVIANMPSVHDVGALARFFAVAFLNTRFLVQVLIVIAGGAFVYTLRELSRSFVYERRFA